MSMRLHYSLALLMFTSVGCTTLESRTFTTDDVAIRGYDPVAYFSQNRPVKGSSQFTHQQAGATWYFENKTNRDLFANAPEAYMPQYGGYCAYAMSKGFIASTAPEAWTIHAGKLYLNYSLRVRDNWLEDLSDNVRKADDHWAEKLKSLADRSCCS
ncbi:MAG: YHS domain-containing (seleno)protein [Nitrospira sp.]